MNQKDSDSHADACQYDENSWPEPALAALDKDRERQIVLGGQKLEDLAATEGAEEDQASAQMIHEARDHMIEGITSAMAVAHFILMRARQMTPEGEDPYPEGTVAWEVNRMIEEWAVRMDDVLLGLENLALALKVAIGDEP